LNKFDIKEFDVYLKNKALFDEESLTVINVSRFKIKIGNETNFLKLKDRVCQEAILT